MRRRHVWRKHPAATRTSCSDHYSCEGRWHDFSMPARYISLGRHEAEAKLREIRKLINSPFMNAKRLKTCWHKLPRQTLRELQAKQLRTYLRDVVLPFHSYYRDLFRRHGLDWRDLDKLEVCKTFPLPLKKTWRAGRRKLGSLSLRLIQSSSRDVPPRFFAVSSQE